MAVTIKQMAVVVSSFGIVSFILGVLAENKKPLVGTLGEDLENGLLEVLVSLAARLRGEGDEGVKPKWDLTLRKRLGSKGSGLEGINSRVRARRKSPNDPLPFLHSKSPLLYTHRQALWPSPSNKCLSLFRLLPASGTPVPSKGGVTCKFPGDPTVALGYLSLGFLAVSTVAGYLSLFYPYKGKSVPLGVLFKNTGFVVFFNIALFTTGLAATMLLWPTITEYKHLTHNVHHDLSYTCPTAKTGLLGGGAFLSLDSCLLWLVALMLADNAREDFFNEDKGDTDKGDDNVSSTSYDAAIAI
ncbi:hypothetical protein SESBI_04452 [Sesbania bispinosa]|nr:hypothetical protein SESBI_04452 [Sesbania bispinosa]